MKQVMIAGLGAALILGGPVLAQDARSISVDSFDRINVGGGYEVEIIAGETSGVRLLGDADDFGEIEIEVRNGRLEVEQESRFFSRRRSLDLVVEITVADLRELDVNRGVSARAQDLDLGDLEVDVSTGGELRLSGRCETLDVDVSTGGYVQAADFVCSTVDARASTGGELRAHATQSVSGRASMGASIRIHGSPSRYEFSTSMGGSADLSGEG